MSAIEIYASGYDAGVVFTRTEADAWRAVARIAEARGNEEQAVEARAIAEAIEENVRMRENEEALSC